ncbi:hypothetical protein GGS23DRAFT_605566 [Durotheca rogersii]|uniref:uncharacterized protein n=1 Tax=Durotheca rogersii TaxID=419775 RepID=UPI00221EE055|nr:uncharacterized protein GGS23DRAFT_605566 [Durotheca rogersii]KAI5862672.1 hypothetical protein GGS23DRAFT_605566 [Durotheca rogersii]
MEPTPSATGSGSGSLRIPKPSDVVPSSSPDVAEVVDSPTSPASPDALARFEFEAGRGNDGSKILMVEWDPAPTAEDGWVVTWEGKRATFPVSERVEPDGDENGSKNGAANKKSNGDDEGGKRRHQQQRRQRIYFLLPSGATVPPAVTITHAASGRALTARSMPAIFAPGLGIGTRDAGRRGVLHTAWARLRAGQLQDEIRRELRDNSESVGLEMAVQERLWIIDHFGLDDLLAEASAAAASRARSEAEPRPPVSPQSPRSPVGGRLGEKLKGLKLATSPTELANPLPRAAGVVSLDAVLGSGSRGEAGKQEGSAPPPEIQSKETEDELFALPMSPRSPEMKTSPFSFLK